MSGPGATSEVAHCRVSSFPLSASRSGTSARTQRANAHLLSISKRETTLPTTQGVFVSRRNGEAVTLDDFIVAIERIVAGLEKRSRILGPEQRRRVAYHEMGHALVAATLSGVDPVHKVSIIPRGVGALGYTMQRPTEDRFLLARHDLENRIAVLMGGRAAEALIFDGEVSTGASDDRSSAKPSGRS
jgi:ATP-dependent Zn protease